MDDAEALTEPTGFRFPSNRRLRYEQLDDLPWRLLVAEDAMASFNPIYGQGMSVAALAALALRDLLVDEVSSPQDWFATIAPTANVAWDMATSADLAVGCIDGHRSPPTRLIGGYIARLHAAAVHDPVLTSAFWRVAGLLDPPTRLLRPGTMLRVLRGNLRRRPSEPVHTTTA